MAYNEEDFLQLSGLQHFRFCRRQWALIHIEHQWAENGRTIDGAILHENAHNADFQELRGDRFITRGVSVYSAELGVSGQCDVLEYRRGAAGIPLAGKAGLWQPYPVEYKRGRPREDTGDALQLCAQAMCLESMLCCGIPEGALCAPRSPSAQRLQRGSRLIFRENRRIPVLFQAAAAPSSRKTAENSMFLTKIHRSNCASLLSLPPRGAWIEIP